MSKFQPPKGTRDHLFDSFARRRRVAERMLQVTERFGFRQVQTPVIEYFEVLAAKAGPDVAEQIYAFDDKGGRKLGLRAEHTASIARVVASEGHTLPRPIKVAAYGTVYRYERPQSGRQREFTQVNVETYGAAGPLADAETIACFAECYRAIGLTEFEVRISDRRLLDAVLAHWGVADPGEVVRAIDKRGKLADGAWQGAVVAAGLPAERLDGLVAVLSTGGDLRDAEAALAALGLADAVGPLVGDLRRLEEFLRALGVGDLCRFDFSIARGLAYYTGTVFEGAPTGAGQGFGAIGGGGRYDNLIEIYGGPPTPAIGFAVGLERVMLLLETLGRLPPERPDALRFFIAWYDETCQGFALEVARALHAVARDLDDARPEGSPARLHVAVALAKQPFKKQFQAAGQGGATHVVVIGPEEVAAKVVKVKDLATGTETTRTLAELVAAIPALLGPARC
jgi:histidyl-tRNA synthetase